MVKLIKQIIADIPDQGSLQLVNSMIDMLMNANFGEVEPL
jgi:hypothetical protein